MSIFFLLIITPPPLLKQLSFHLLAQQVQGCQSAHVANQSLLVQQNTNCSSIQPNYQLNFTKTRILENFSLQMSGVVMVFYLSHIIRVLENKIKHPEVILLHNLIISVFQTSVSSYQGKNHVISSCPQSHEVLSLTTTLLLQLLCPYTQSIIIIIQDLASNLIVSFGIQEDIE